MVLINPPAPDRVFYTHLFGRLVRDRRRTLNLTIEQAAELTGITSSEWIAIEAGYVPQEYKMVRTISETLSVRTSDLLMASIMSTLAQEQTVQ
jgi:transcriptional regulator with XRE-family HTH domain